MGPKNLTCICGSQVAATPTRDGDFPRTNRATVPAAFRREMQSSALEQYSLETTDTETAKDTVDVKMQRQTSTWPPTAEAFVEILRQARDGGTSCLHWKQIKERFGRERLPSRQSARCSSLRGRLGWTVRRAFEQYAGGNRSMLEIADELNAAGFRPRSKRGRLVFSKATERGTLLFTAVAEEEGGLISVCGWRPRGDSNPRSPP